MVGIRGLSSLRNGKGRDHRTCAENQSFNFTMLTVDTHHIGGYVCDKCLDIYADQTANVVVCADSLVGEFIAWCKEQAPQIHITISRCSISS